MTNPSDTLAEQAAALAARFAELSATGGDEHIADALAGLSDAAVLELLERIGAVVHLAEAVAAHLAGQVEVRSARGVEEPLAKRIGEKSAAAAVAVAAHVPLSRAVEWCRVGTDLARRTSLTGEPLDSPHPVIAAAFDAGSIDIAAARTAVRTLEALAPRVDSVTLAQLEAVLAAEAVDMPLALFARYCRDVLDRFDPDGVEPREETLHRRRAFRLAKHRDGLPLWIIAPDAEGAGFILTALEARVAPRRQVSFQEEGEEDSDRAVEDERTTDQKRYDALVSICHDALKHDDGDLSGTAVTMLVTVGYDALVNGVGSATIFGSDEPISAATARRLACEADIIPVVLGGESEPLDLGERRRLFATNQRLALALRDGGCIWPGCPEPPARCEAAHVKPWWAHGPTDLDNGVLLCRFHHRRFDNDGWTLRMLDGVPHLVPPPWIDAGQTPRRAGRHLLPTA
ncbi:HNH endonuclease signature motif containing protein [Naasia sp. SYSU D00057]|uniref:HNH endonuclease signature motif containing protein n=1 Tax=Naasia sp. SYSU D00057 TaxID=2817380 RepID=UPI001B313DA3|nr:HNH endonuclease signature motif containing protein [Naasia sp. SYSU D00057]